MGRGKKTGDRQTETRETSLQGVRIEENFRRGERQKRSRDRTEEVAETGDRKRDRDNRQTDSIGAATIGRNR